MSALPAQALREAALWFVELNSGEVSAADRQRWADWLAADPSHARAWEHAASLSRHFEGVPAQLGHKTLAAPRDMARRQALKYLVLVAGVGAVGWNTSQSIAWQSWRASYRTSVGERRQLTLSDGTQVTMNTASAFDLDFNAQERLLRLIDGEILITTARDSRAMRVQTPAGSIRPLGTRFLVRSEDDSTTVSVFEGQVRLNPLLAPSQSTLLGSGQRCSMSRRATSPVLEARSEHLAWVQGMLIADDMDLATFGRELARYRSGYLGCDARVAQLRISGSFPLNDSDRALASLEHHLPVRIRRITRFWAQIEPA